MGNVHVLGAGSVNSINGVTGAVQIGGRNYLSRSSPSMFPDGWNAFGQMDSNPLPIGEDGYIVADHFVGNYLSICPPKSSANKQLEYGTYTISFDIYANVEINSASPGTPVCSIFFLYGSNGPNHGILPAGLAIPAEPTRISHTFTLDASNDPGEGWRIGVCVYITADPKPEWVLHLKDVKLERGNVATEWTPALEDLVSSASSVHRNIFRGKSLGSAFTDAQKAAIAAGTWDDLYLGDYWTINNHTWRIADFDYWLGKGDTSCTKHHIVVVPDASLYSAQMHNTVSGAYEAGATANTTAGGYFNSGMRTTNLTRAKTLIETDFGTGSILKHRILLTNAVKDGYPSAGNWYDSEVDLMNEMMVYGAYHFAPRGNGTIITYNHTTEYTQLALFQVAPYYIMPNRSWYWLRDVVSAAFFAGVDYNGISNYYNASFVGGVRPAVGIVGS